MNSKIKLVSWLQFWWIQQVDFISAGKFYIISDSNLVYIVNLLKNEEKKFGLYIFGIFYVKRFKILIYLKYPFTRQGNLNFEFNKSLVIFFFKWRGLT